MQECPTIAVCIAARVTKSLTFKMKNYPPSYRVSCYFIDYNTCSRSQIVSLSIGNCTSEKYHLGENEDFCQGQWVTWEIYNAESDIIELNIEKFSGPNWVLSALLIDPIKCDSTSRVLEQVYLFNIDKKTQGAWIGHYGQFGGIIFHHPLFVIPSREKMHDIRFSFEISKDCQSMGIYGYNWKKNETCLNDCKGCRYDPSTWGKESEDKRAMDNPYFNYGFYIKG